MVGICGVLGGGDLPEEMAARTRWGDDDVTFTYGDDHVELALSCHPLLVDDLPVAVDDDDLLLWLWGEVYGHGSGDGYEPRPGGPGGSAAYCAELYREHGPTFVEELNGQFALVLYDRTTRTISFVTDRLSTRPIYWAEPTDDTFVFGSNLQSLSLHEAVPVEFDPSYLQEYLALRRVFGRETPLEGVRELPPASVTTVDLLDTSAGRTTWTYWRPTYEPVDRPLSYFVDRLADTMVDLFDEWTRDDLRYGTLLSGGSDSRLVQAAIDQGVISYHNADWMSREARIARRVTDASGDEFRLLERFDDHEARSLETTPALSNFSGWFDQAYFTEFESQIRDEVDVLVSGLFSDQLFAGMPLATRSLSLGSVGTLSLPVAEPIRTVEDWIDAKLEEARPLPYFDSVAGRSLREILRENVEQTDEGIVSHGVRYGSLTDLVMYGDYYPLGANTEAIFPRSLMQIRPYRSPFFDNRVFEIHRRMPAKYFLRRNVVNAAIEKIDSRLAAIPHARTGVSLAHGFPVEFVGRNLHGFFRKHIGEETAPDPHLDHKPWPNRQELLRAEPFAAETIRENEALIRSLPFLDYEGAERTYRNHLDGEDNTIALYSLLTFLEMPLTDAIRPGSTATAVTEGRPPEVGASEGGS